MAGIDDAWRRAQNPMMSDMRYRPQQPPPTNWQQPPPGFTRWQPQQGSPTDVQMPQRTLPTGMAQDMEYRPPGSAPRPTTMDEAMRQRQADMQRMYQQAQQQRPIQEPMGQWTGGGSAGAQMGGSAGAQMGGQQRLHEQAMGDIQGRMQEKQRLMAAGGTPQGNTGSNMQLEQMGGGQDRPMPFGGGRMDGNPFAGNPFGGPPSAPTKKAPARKPAAKKSAPAKASASKAPPKAAAKSKAPAKKAPPAFARKGR